MKRRVVLFVMLLIWIAPLQILAEGVNLKAFSDLNENDWSAEYVYSLTALGHLSGYPNQTFAPERKVTREEFIKMFAGAVKLSSPDDGAESPFKDVEKNRWSYLPIVAAYQNRLLDFMAVNQQIYPSKEIAREEVAALVGKYLLSKESGDKQSSWLDSGWKSEQAAASFSDGSGFNLESSPYAYYAVQQKIMLGDSKGTFRPKDSLSRKEASAIIYRLIDAQTEANAVDLMGFYAIRSYSNISKIPVLDHFYLGWAKMNYREEGFAWVDTSPGEWGFPKGWEEVVEWADQHQVSKDLAVFYDNSNLADFLRDEQAQASFIRSLIEIIKQDRYGFSGVCVDFEGLADANLQGPYVHFLKNLKEKLDQKTLTVAVPPTNYYKGYDLKEIGRVADYVLFMAHDFTHDPSRLPSAPLPLVNDAVRQAVQVIPKEKLILGISKQANQWQPNASKSVQPAIDKVESRLKQPGTEMRFSMPFFLQQITYHDGAGEHLIWYEDTESIKKKIWLAKYYGLKGVSLWHMGNITEKDWAMIEKIKNK